jgi:hypothetical protein
MVIASEYHSQTARYRKQCPQSSECSALAMVYTPKRESTEATNSSRKWRIIRRFGRRPFWSNNRSIDLNRHQPLSFSIRLVREAVQSHATATLDQFIRDGLRVDDDEIHGTAVLTSVLGFSADPWTMPANGTPRAVLEGM